MQNNQQKQSPIIFIVLVVLFVAGGFSYWYVKNKNQPTKPTTPPSTDSSTIPTIPTSTENPNANKHFVSKIQNLEFDYPALFNLTETNQGKIISLKSQYYITPEVINGSIIDESVPPHYFGITFETKNMSLIDAMKQDNPFYAEAYLMLTTTTNPKPSPAYAMNQETVAGKKAYSFQAGSEGINTKFVYIIKNDSETLLVKLASIGDFLKESTEPSHLPENEQSKAFETVLQSLQIK